MIELAKKFVPVTDEVWRLQFGEEPECKFFQAMAKHGHYKATNSSQQGIYVCSPSGKFLASINSNFAEHVLDTMEAGLAAWEDLSDEERHLENPAWVQADERMERREPEDGLILAMVARDLPENGDPRADREEHWNRDTVWFSKQEAAAMIPESPQVGQEFVLAKGVYLSLGGASHGGHGQWPNGPL